MGTAAAIVQNTISLTRETLSEFQRHKAQWLAAAIAYYTLFAIAPLIIIVVEIAGFFLGTHQAILNHLYSYMSTTAGPSASHGIQSVVTTTFSHKRAGIISQIIGWAVLLLAAVGLFSSLQDALNTVWDVTPKKRTILETLRQRLLSFGTVLGIAFLLLVSLGLNALLTLATNALSGIFGGLPILLNVLDFIASLGIAWLLFSFMFAFLPEQRIGLREVWVGALFSALLFVIGQFLLGWYLRVAGIASAYGSFGGIVVFLIWVNYSAQIMLFGAEFTHVYSRHAESASSKGRSGLKQRHPVAATKRPHPTRSSG